MDTSLTLVLSVGAALLGVCTVYAYALEHTPYKERDTWKTVVVGNGFILIAIGVLSLLEIVDPAIYWLYTGYNVVAGLPIIIWQWTHYAKEQARINAIITDRSPNGQEVEHAADSWRG
jgi:heme O synthase-like polyprenyltransferase